MSPLRSIGPVLVAVAGCLAFPAGLAAQDSQFFVPPTGSASATSSTLTVGPAGSGAQYHDLQAALDAAPPDALVLVAAGGWNAITVTKPVRIVGKGSNVTTIQAHGPAANDPESLPPPGSPAIVVRGIEAGRSVTIAGFRLLQAPGPSVAALVEECAGQVRFVDVTHFPSFQVTTTPKPVVHELGLVTVRACADVHLQSCRFLGVTTSAQSIVAADGLHGLAVADSIVTLVDSTFRGNGAVGAFGSVQLGRGGNGIRATYSVVRMARAQIRGGDGGIALFSAGGGAAALRTDWTAALVAGGPGAALQGGKGKSNAGWNGPVVQPGGASVQALGGDVVVAWDAALEPGAGGDGWSAAPISQTLASVQQLPWRLPTVTAAPALVGSGGAMQLRITGAPFTPIWAWYGTVLHAPSLGIPIQFQLDGSSSMSLGAWILGFDGSLQFPLALPNSPGLVGQTIAIQVIGFAGGSPQASLPALLVVGG